MAGSGIWGVVFSRPVMAGSGVNGLDRAPKLYQLKLQIVNAELE